jgi:MFS transporter, DHA2 family, methylenomycin A resistance protein
MIKVKVRINNRVTGSDSKAASQSAFGSTQTDSNSEYQSGDPLLTTTVEQRKPAPRFALAVAVLGLFIVTLDALVVNVALPAIGHDLGGGITGLQWVVDGYTLVFAALLLSAGALSNRIGARQSLAAGLASFIVASLGCGLAPVFWLLVVSRLVQGAGAPGQPL